MLLSVAVNFNAQFLGKFLFNSILVGVVSILAFNLWIFLVLKLHKEEGRDFLVKLSAACFLVFFLVAGLFVDSLVNSDLLLFLISFVLFFVMLFLFLLKINKETVGKSVWKTVLSFVLVAFVFIIPLFISAGEACTLAVVSPSLRTNIFTGECSFGGGGSSGCYSETGPWYYKKGCDVSRDEAVEAIKKSDSADLLEYCDRLCKEGSAGYCDKLDESFIESFMGPFSFSYNLVIKTQLRYKRISEEFSCQDLVSCGTVFCDGTSG